MRVFSPFIRVGKEKGAAVFVLAEIPDNFLAIRRRGQPLDKDFRILGVDLGEFLRIDGNQGDIVQKGFIPFHQNGQFDLTLHGEIGCPVDNRIGFLLVGVAQGRGISFRPFLINLVPGAAWFDRPFPIVPSPQHEFPIYPPG